MLLTILYHKILYLNLKFFNFENDTCQWCEPSLLVGTGVEAAPFPWRSRTLVTCQAKLGVRMPTKFALRGLRGGEHRSVSKQPRSKLSPNSFENLSNSFSGSEDYTSADLFSGAGAIKNGFRLGPSSATKLTLGAQASLAASRRGLIRLIPMSSSGILLTWRPRLSMTSRPCPELMIQPIFEFRYFRVSSFRVSSFRTDPKL